MTNTPTIILDIGSNLTGILVTVVGVVAFVAIWSVLFR